MQESPAPRLKSTHMHAHTTGAALRCISEVKDEPGSAAGCESTSSLAAGQKPPKDLVVRRTSLRTDLGVCATRVAANQAKRFNPGMKKST